MYAIINNLLLLFPRRIDDEIDEGLFAAVLEAYPGSVRDLIIDGCERRVMGTMLDGALAWTRAQGWPAWDCEAAHPVPGEMANAFWTRMRTKLAGGRAAVIVGFDEDDRPGSRYEPHWTCVEEVGRWMIYLKDSLIYRRVLRSETGLQPEPRWAIEDAFVLRRSA